METLDFSGSGQAEAFFCAGMRFHFWHIRDFSERKYSYLFVKWAKKIELIADSGDYGAIRKTGLAAAGRHKKGTTCPHDRFLRADILATWPKKA